MPVTRIPITIIVPALLISLGFITTMTTPYMGVASLNFFLLCVGITYRHIPKYHSRTMSFAMISDVLLVLVIELQRSAINTAASFNLNIFQQLHIITATIAVVLYFPTFYYGLKRLKGTDANTNSKHFKLAIGAFTFRAVSFFLMFSLLDHVNN